MEQHTRAHLSGTNHFKHVKIVERKLLGMSDEEKKVMYEKIKQCRNLLLKLAVKMETMLGRRKDLPENCIFLENENLLLMELKDMVNFDLDNWNYSVCLILFCRKIVAENEKKSRRNRQRKQI